MVDWHNNLLKRVPVVVGIVINAKGQVLVAKRKSHQHQGDKWEFPGGKLEPGESQADALKRELLEEVGIWVVDHFPWLDIHHDYQDKAIALHVHQVRTFQGKAYGCEGQTIAWLYPKMLFNLSFPKANELIIRHLATSRCLSMAL